MTFVSPIWLLGLLPVAAAAVAAFVRPARREVVVGSLALWRAAAQSVGGEGAKSTRRIPPGWSLLLAGATLAVLALAQPIWPYDAKEQDAPTAEAVPAASRAITFDALSGETRPDGQAEIFVRLRNPTDQTFTGLLTIAPTDSSPDQAAAITIPPKETWQTVQLAPNSPTLNVRVMNPQGASVAAADVHKIQAGLTHVAVQGDIGAVLHRYIQADPRLALVASPADADVMILTRETLPRKNVPALVLAPPNPPFGWGRGEDRFAVTFAQADVAADDPVMKDVHVAAMAVRRMPSWKPGEAMAGKALLMMNRQAVIARSTPEKHPSAGEPRRVYVAFAITPDNTNIEESPAPFLTLLANAIRWLHPANDAQGRYVRERGTFKRRSDEIGTTPVGALAEKHKAPTSSNTSLKVPRELSPWLIVAAMLCWILGWRQCGRKAV